jgi:hypothetical protein
MQQILLACLLLLPSLVAATASSDAPADDPSPVQLEGLLVSGEQPGPGMWRVSNGDNVLWIMATHSPLPKRMTWRSAELESRIAESQQVIGDVRVSLDGSIGRFRALLLVPSLLGARRNPGDRSLAEVIPPALHERWSVLKARYIGRNRQVEGWRPIFAAQRLYERAVDKSGLSSKGVVWSEAEKIAKRRRVPVSRPTLAVAIDAPKQAIREFSTSTLDDVACLERTVERLETDLDAMRARANAWAVGDLEALQALPHPDNAGACRDAILQAGLLEKRGLDDLPQRRMQAWLEAIDEALARNASTVAVVSLDILLRPGGYLDALRARGYAVEAPE